MAAEPFIWGRAGAKLTPDQIAKEREMADALAKGAMDYSPVGHWSQGLNRVAQGLLAGLDYRNADRAEGENATYNSEILNSLLGGSSPVASAAMPTTTGAGEELAATSPAVGGTDAYRNAIASIESAGSGDYAAVGPTNPRLGRALGRYQIMEANIGPWSQEALGRAVTPEEFLANPQLQDAIFDKKFGSYVEQFGPEGAAQAWFAGPGGVGKLDRKDVLGTDVGTYSKKFLNALGPEVAAATPQAAIEAVSPSGYVDPMVSAPNAQTELAPPLPAPVEVAPAPAVAAVPQQQVAQALTASPQQQAPGINPAILRALTDPRATPQTRAVAQALMQQQMGEQQSLREMQLRQQDPRYQQQLQLGQLELERARNPQPDYQIVQDRSTGEVIAVDRNNPLAGPQVIRKGGLSMDAPTTRTIKQPDGSEVAVQWDGEKRQWVPLAAPEGGNPVQSIPKLTEQQSKDLVYYQRGASALQDLNNMENALTSATDAGLAQVPIVGNMLVSNEFQQADQAGRNFLASILRKDTGAAVTTSEMNEYGKIFLPRPGDSPETLAQKRAARIEALQAIRSGLGVAERVLQNRADQQEEAEPDFSTMSDEELQRYINGN